MVKRTKKGFDYGNGEFISYKDAERELADSLCDTDEDGFFSRKEQEEYAKFIIAHCKDGAYL